MAGRSLHTGSSSKGPKASCTLSLSGARLSSQLLERLAVFRGGLKCLSMTTQDARPSRDQRGYASSIEESAKVVTLPPSAKTNRPTPSGSCGNNNKKVPFQRPATGTDDAAWFGVQPGSRSTYQSPSQCKPTYLYFCQVKSYAHRTDVMRASRE